MAVLLFHLQGVPEDEAAQLRLLLTEGGFDWYETSAGRWGTAVAAVWLRDESQLQGAKQLLEQFQQQRLEDARLGYEPVSFWSHLKASPVRVAGGFLITMIVLYVSLAPFFGLGSP